MLKMKKGSLVEVVMDFSAAPGEGRLIGVVLKGPVSRHAHSDHYLVFLSRTKEAHWAHVSALKCIG